MTRTVLVETRTVLDFNVLTNINQFLLYEVYERKFHEGFI